MPLAAMIVTASVNCWVFAEKHFNVPAYLLYSVAGVESGYDPSAVARARDGSYSVGLMQINSKWFPALYRSGIREVDLRRPCINVQVGAWILAQEIARYGYTWEAIGSYYAGPYNDKTQRWKLRAYRHYAERVLTRWQTALRLAMGLRAST